jgi:CDP-diacylglycerol--glycerol-3-phosphate 3-phosphatidyltransferase
MAQPDDTSGPPTGGPDAVPRSDALAPPAPTATAEPAAQGPAAAIPAAEDPSATSAKPKRKKKPKLSREERRRRRRSLKDEFLNLPNMITMGRVLLIPLYIYWCAEGDPIHCLCAALLFALAAAMDSLDGYLARRLNKVTTVGKFMDPLADKLMVMSALVLLVRLGRVETWVVILLLSREFIVTGLRTIAVGEGLVISASQGGKWKTGLQLTGLVSLTLHYVYPTNFLFATLPVDFHRCGCVLLYASLVPSVSSAVGYFKGFLDEVTRRDAMNKAQRSA